MKKICNNRKELKKFVIYILVIAFLFVMAVPSFASTENEIIDQKETEAESQQEIENRIEEETDDEEMSESTAGEEMGIPSEDTAVKQAEGIPDDNGSEEVIVEATNNDEEETGADGDTEEKESAPQKRMLQAKAGSDTKVSYTGKKVGSAAGETTVFSVKNGGVTYTGTCSKQGVKMSTSGTATITKISNSKKIAKVIYYYAIKLDDSNWWTSDHKTDKVGTILGMSSNDATNVTKRRMLEAFCQIYNMGSSEWYKTITNADTGGWSTDTADKVRDFYTNISKKSWYENLTVPDGFEIWAADAGNAQPFIIWAYTPPTPPAPSVPTGFVTMKKVSGNTSITG